MNTKLAIALVAGLGVPFAAAAQTESSSTRYSTRTTTTTTPSDYYSRMSYTLADARLLANSPDRGDDADGIRLSGSYLLERNFFLRGAVMTAEGGGRYGTDMESAEVGVGMRHPFTSSVDLVGMAGIIRSERDFGRAGEASGWGPSLLGGARSSLTPRVEIGGYAGYVELFGDGTVAAIGEGLYHFTPNFSAVAGLMLSDENREANLGGRWNFR